MSKFKIINLIDKLFVSISIFLIIYAWINFYIRNLWTTFILSLIFSFACVFLLYYILDKRDTKTNQKKETQNKINLTYLAYFLSTKDDKIKLLYEMLSKEYTVNISNNTLIYTKDNKKHIMIQYCNINKLDNNSLMNLLAEYVKKEHECIDIICSEYDSNVNIKIYQDKTINIIDKNKLYTEYFSKYDIFPDTSKLNTSINKINMKDIIINVFSKSKAKSYFICGLILIFSSIIIPYHAYYVVMGSMLLLFAIICKILPYTHR